MRASARNNSRRRRVVYKGVYRAGRYQPPAFVDHDPDALILMVVDATCAPMDAFWRGSSPTTRVAAATTAATGTRRASSTTGRFSRCSTRTSNIGQEQYTIFDAIRAAVEKVNDEIQLAELETVMERRRRLLALLPRPEEPQGRPRAGDQLEPRRLLRGRRRGGRGLLPGARHVHQHDAAPLVATRDRVAPKTAMVLNEFIPFNNDWCDPMRRRGSGYARHAPPRTRAAPRRRAQRAAQLAGPSHHQHDDQPRLHRLVVGRRLFAYAYAASRCSSTSMSAPTS